MNEPLTAVEPGSTEQGATPTSLTFLRSHAALSWLLAAGVAAVAALQLLPFLTWSPQALTARGLLIDDAFFYSVLAQNFHELGFLTLDGVMATNGVQPLWMVVQILLTGLLPAFDSAALLAWASWLFYVLFALAAAWYVARWSAAHHGRWAAVAAVVVLAGLLLLNAEFQQLVMRGLETPLLLFLLVLLLFVVDAATQRPRVTPGVAAALGAVATLCFLARTDLFWVVLAVGGWLLLWKRPSPATLIAFGLPVALLTVPYLAFNVTTQDGLMPLSGRVKLFYLHIVFPTLPDYLASEEWRGLFSAFGRLLPLPGRVVMVLTVPLLALGFWAVWRGRPRSPATAALPTAVSLLSWVVLGHLLFMHVAYRELRPYTSYYFAPELLWFSLVVALQAGQWIGAARSGRWMRRAPALALLLLAVGVAAVAWVNRDWQPRDYWTQRLALAEAIPQHVPPGARVGAFWPGVFAQFSERPIVPLDGIIGSQDYFESYVQHGCELSYLADESIPYLIIWLGAPPQEMLAAAEPPPITDWSDLGLLRLWQYRHVPMRVVEARLVNEAGAGWYLLALDHGRTETR